MTKIFSVVAVALLVCPTTIVAQSEMSEVAKSQREAMAVLATGLDALGGVEQLQAMSTIRYRAKVTRYQFGQAVRADAEGQGRAQSAVVSWTSDMASDRWYADMYREEDAPSPFLTVVWAEDEGFLHVVGPNTVRDLTADNRFLASIRRGVTFAPDLLLEAWERVETLRVLAARQDAGHRQSIITFADAGGTQVALGFDAATGHLLFAEQLESHNQFGDMSRTVEFADYRHVGKLMLPYSIKSSTGPFVDSEAAGLELTVAVQFDESRLERPADATAPVAAGLPTGPAAERRVEEIVPGVYQIMNVTLGYNVTFVAQSNRVIVFEAPGDPAKSVEVLETVREVLPEAEVEAFVLTHHHFDHSAGLYTYLREGMKIITTPGDEEFVKRVAGSPRAGQRSGLEPDIRLVEGRGMFGSGVNRFELIDAGPNPHAEQILIAYFPEHKLVYVPDIYGYVPGFTPPPLLRAFADRMDDLDLDVEMFATAHTEPRTVAEYQEMVEQAREGD